MKYRLFSLISKFFLSDARKTNFLRVFSLPKKKPSLLKMFTPSCCPGWQEVFNKYWNDFRYVTAFANCFRGGVLFDVALLQVRRNVHRCTYGQARFTSIRCYPV
jgi:hypothetical protein